MWVLGPKRQSHILLLSKAHQQEMRSEVEQPRLEQVLKWGDGIVGGGFNLLHHSANPCLFNKVIEYIRMKYKLDYFLSIRFSFIFLLFDTLSWSLQSRCGTMKYSKPQELKVPVSSKKSYARKTAFHGMQIGQVFMSYRKRMFCFVLLPTDTEELLKCALVFRKMSLKLI